MFLDRDQMVANRFGLSVASVLLVCMACGCERKRNAQNPPTQEVISSEQSDPMKTESAAKASSEALTQEPKDMASANSSAQVDSNATLADSERQRRVGIDDANPAQLRSAIRRSLSEGQDQLAFRLVRQLMRVSGDHPESVFLHALVLGKRQRFHEAVRILDQLATQSPETRLPALGQTAQWLVDAGRFDEAEGRYRTVLEAVPSASLAHRYLALLLVQTGKRTEAADHLRFLGRLGQLNQEELRLLLAVSTPLNQEMLSPRTKPLTPLADARLELASGNLDKAREYLESTGTESNAYEESLQARLNASQKQFDAVENWASNRDVFKNDADGWFAMGCLAANQNDHPKAIDFFCKALLIDHTDAEVYQWLSESAQAIGKPAVADEANKRAKLIRQTLAIGEKLSDDTSKNRELISSLIPLLQSLGRPLEVLGWENVDLFYAVTEGTMTDSEAEKAFADIAQQREQLIQSGQDSIDRSFVLCGLEFGGSDSGANDPQPKTDSPNHQ